MLEDRHKRRRRLNITFGTQGDPWDTQADMATALVGALVAVVFLSKRHDRALARAGDPPPVAV